MVPVAAVGVLVVCYGFPFTVFPALGFFGGIFLFYAFVPLVSVLTLLWDKCIAGLIFLLLFFAFVPFHMSPSSLVSLSTQKLVSLVLMFLFVSCNIDLILVFFYYLSLKIFFWAFDPLGNTLKGIIFNKRVLRKDYQVKSWFPKTLYLTPLLVNSPTNSTIIRAIVYWCKAICCINGVNGPWLVITGVTHSLLPKSCQ